MTTLAPDPIGLGGIATLIAAGGLLSVAADTVARGFCGVRVGVEEEMETDFSISQGSGGNAIAPGERFFTVATRTRRLAAAPIPLLTPEAVFDERTVRRRSIRYWDWTKARRLRS